MIDCLLSMLENLGLILNTEKKMKRKEFGQSFSCGRGSVDQCCGSALSGGMLELSCQEQCNETVLWEAVVGTRIYILIS